MRIICLLLISALLFTLGMSLACAMVVGPDFPVCTDPAYQGTPVTSGNIVVWSDIRNGNQDVFGKNLSTGQEFPICTAPGYQYSITISGNIVVWMDNRNSNYDIYGYNLSMGQELPICTAAGNQYSPDISGNTVVWEDNRNDNWDIYGYDLSTGQEFSICTAPGDQNNAAISGNIVVWNDNRNGNTDIYGYDLVTHQEFPVCTEATDQMWPDISGNKIVWCDSRNGRGVYGYDLDIYGYDLATSQEFPICTAPGVQTTVAIAGSIVVWGDLRSDPDASLCCYGGQAYDIYGYDLSTSQEFIISGAANNQQYPAISGNTIVWMDNRNGNQDIYGCWLINTPEGNNVATTVGDAENPVTLTFPTVTTSGVTTAEVTTTPPAPTPSGFNFLDNYYDISTTATFSGAITIAIPYDDSGLSSEQEASLMLLHYDEVAGKWVDITTSVDTVNNIIYGQTTSLSPFAVAVRPVMEGFLPPINMDGSSIFKLKSTIPVKLRLKDAAGNAITNASVKLYVAKISNAVVGSYEEAVATNSPDAGNTFRYDGGQYIFNLGTKALSAGTWRLKADCAGLTKLEVSVSLR
jgi:beta propeller repeat protein